MADSKESKGIIDQIFSGNILSGNNGKLVRRLIILIFAGIVFITLGNLADSDRHSQVSPVKDSNIKVSKQNSQSYDPESMMEEKLVKTLSNISGVRKVAVDITLDTSSKYEYARNNNISSKLTDEVDSNGGERQIEQEDRQQEVVIIRNNDGSEEAVVKKEIKAQIRGVMVVAQGAESSYIKANLISAVKVGLGVPAYKIVVLPMKR
ncbi:hypothetical protein [Selenihalanaerobacter shriftii]|uniref:Stage III sporulation protein AG n=1 Tax=Selenihalanaerobacter shriftii TaxID=142842 RepID=A0A1T4P491_9FIRM|nr:hypothetical protein [Selenihalanaerobacter shriftii]SJZ85748.1 stage III sporulation protein AG [Selenihalanaerobacter shriftii]